MEERRERLQSMSVQRQSVYVIRVQTESGCQKGSRAHRLSAPPLSAPSLSAPLPSPTASLPPLEPPHGGCDAMAPTVAVSTQHIQCAITLRKEQSIYDDKASSAKIYIHLFSRIFDSNVDFIIFQFFQNGTFENVHEC